MRSTAGAAELFLREGFLPAAAYLGACEGGGGAAAFVVEVGGDTAVDDGACCVWTGGFEVDGGFADFGAVEGEDRKCGEFRADYGGGFEAVGVWGFEEEGSGGVI